jgi:perosamine synthetase
MRTARLAIHGGPPEVDIAPPHFRWPLIGKEEEEAILRQLRTGELSVSDRTGSVAQLEDDFAAFHGLRYAMSTNSGTSALHAAFFALDLEPGDEVLAPAYTHLSTVAPMLQANLVPVLCDVDPESANLDPDEAEHRLSSRTRAIVLTHQYGRVCDMEAILSLARRHRLRVIEDCSHAHGATHRGHLAGTFGDVSCFSLQADKVVPVGEGGVLLTDDPAIFERAALLGHFRRPTRATSPAYLPFAETGYGLKYRLHPLAAALGIVGLRKLPERIRQRRANLEYFDECVAFVPGVRPLATPPGDSRGGFFRYVLKLLPDQLDGVSTERYVEALRAEGVAEVKPGSLVKPLHLTPLFQTSEDRMYRTGWPRRGSHVRREIAYGPGDFPQAESFAERTIQFPAFTEPSTHIVEAYCRAMAKVATRSEELVQSRAWARTS